jgi:hypothetical protein
VGGYRAFLIACEEILAPRGVELLPDENARAYHPRFAGEVFARFNAGGPDPVGYAAVVGAEWVLVYGPAFVAALCRAGFTPAARLSPAKLNAETRALLGLPGDELVLLRAPFPAAVVEPRPDGLELCGNTLQWTARAGTAYLVRYAWYPSFRARQGGRELPVEAVDAVPGLDLAYMRVRAEEDGPLALTFRGGWL